MIAEPPYLAKKLRGVRADAAADVGLGHEGKQVALGGLTDLDDDAIGILTVGGEERDEVVADDGADGLAFLEREAETPEDTAGPDGPREECPRAETRPSGSTRVHAGLATSCNSRGRKEDSRGRNRQGRARPATRPSPR